MTYEEFLAKRRAGTIRAGIDNSTALRLVEYLPRRYRAAVIFWGWVWLFSIPAFICVSIFWKWWIGILGIFFVTPMISGANKQTAASFVLEYAEENEEFFYQLMTSDVLQFVEKD